MSAFRWSLVAIPLLAIAGCTPPPPSGPEVDGGYAPNNRARGFIDAQLASHPNGTEPGITGEEANVIYRNYLRSIGGHPIGAGGQTGSGSPGGGSAGGGGAGGTPVGAAGGGGGGYP